MIVSLIQMIIELPELSSIKDKRSIVKSLKDKIIRKFKISIAEVDLQDSLSFAQIGGAVVSNSKTYGEKVLQHVLEFTEDEVPGRLHHFQIVSKSF